MDVRSEAEFIEAMDCAFPYGDAQRVRALIEEACLISGNAAFMVAHELARRPEASRASDELVLGLLDQLGECLVHPLKDAVFAVARGMIRGEELEYEACIALMERIAAYVGEYNALGIVLCACEEARMADANRVYEGILEQWKRSDLTSTHDRR